MPASLSDIFTALTPVCAAVQGVVQVYTFTPEAPPVDGGVVFLSPEWTMEMIPIGNQTVTWKIKIAHVFKRTKADTDLERVSPLVINWLSALSAIPNISLNNTAFLMYPESGDIELYTHSGQSYIAIVHRILVMTTYPIIQ